MDIRKYLEMGVSLPLGISGENGIESYEFGYGDWASSYGEGVLSINHQRPGDSSPYPVGLTTSGHIAHWDVTAADVQYSGHGRIQVVYAVNGVMKKSMTGTTVIEPSLGENVGADPAIQSYIDTMVEIKDEAYQSMVTAVNAKDVAVQKAQDVLGLTAEATINNNVGTPNVDVAVTTEGDHKKMSFSFENLKGEQGEIGLTPSFSIGEVETLDAGEDATASITGTDEEPVLNLGLPLAYPSQAQVNTAIHEATSEIDTAVADWLDDHPEATTTVEDGAITTAKLADGAVTDAKLAQSGGVLEEVADLKNAFSDFEDAISQTELIKSSNLFDIGNATTGYYWSSGHVDSTSYNNTGYIEVEEGKTFTYQYGTKDVSGNRVIASMRFIAAYDENKNYVSSASKTAQTSYTVPNGVKYVILGIARGFLPLDNSRWSAVVYSTEVVPYEDYIVPYTKTEIKVDALPSIVRRATYILATDTEDEIIEKLVDAYNAGNTDVFFERADYSFGDGLASVATTYNLASNEIPIGNGCRYFFNGATLTATLDLDNLTPAVGGDEFYCNFFGCQRVPSSYEMYDGVLVATDTRYIVHDEASALSGTYKHLYQNMEMHYHTENRQEAIRKCIGGGTGASGVIEILGCKFITDGTDSCVSYHGNANDVLGAEFNMNVRNSWFSNSMRAGALSEHQTGRLFYVGNSSRSALQAYENWTVTAFLNEVRS